MYARYILSMLSVLKACAGACFFLLTQSFVPRRECKFSSFTQLSCLEVSFWVNKLCFFYDVNWFDTFFFWPVCFYRYSPNIKQIKVVSHRKVRRARLYYLRDKLPRFSTFKWKTLILLVSDCFSFQICSLNLGIL